MIFNYLFNILFLFRIRTSQFQLLGAACLFLASKFKAVEHLSSEMMVSYTDYSVTVTELKVSPPLIGQYAELRTLIGQKLYL